MDTYLLVYWDGYLDGEQREFYSHREDAEQAAIKQGGKAKVYELVLISEVVEKLERVVE